MGKHSTFDITESRHSHPPQSWLTNTTPLRPPRSRRRERSESSPTVESTSINSWTFPPTSFVMLSTPAPAVGSTVVSSASLWVDQEAPQGEAGGQAQREARSCQDSPPKHDRCPRDDRQRYRYLLRKGVQPGRNQA